MAAAVSIETLNGFSHRSMIRGGNDIKICVSSGLILIDSV
jgi:hypothetical protein